jgi:hypothetical protein
VNGERGTANQDWKQFGLSNHLLLVASVSPGLSKLIWHNDVEPPLASNAWGLSKLIWHNDVEPPLASNAWLDD